MVKIATLLSSMVLFLLPLAGEAQNVQISVDRTNLTHGETLTLTIRLSQQRSGAQPDLSALEPDFEIIGRRTSSQIRSVNNRIESWTDYILILFPNQPGQFEIPSIEIAGQRTEPISITVVAPDPNAPRSSKDMFLEISTNKESVYVQEQLLVTMRLHYIIKGIRNAQFTELDMEDVVIQLIGSPNQYTKLIDGAPFQIYEKQYVIFPQKSGTLEIPDILFRADVTDGSSNFVFRNMNTRRITAFASGFSIEVKERPESFPRNRTWLPARGITLEERWSDNFDTVLSMGDTVNRTMTITADGLGGAVLPPFDQLTAQGLNFYPDPAEINRTYVDGSIMGTRLESVAIVPTSAGEHVIPEISIPWWDIASDQLRYATLPATSLRVAGLASPVTTEPDIAAVIEATPPAQINDNFLEEIDQASGTEMPMTWFYIVAAVCACLLCYYYYWLRSGGIFGSKSTADSGISHRIPLPEDNPLSGTEKSAYKDLLRACKGSDYRLISHSLIFWGKHHYGDRNLVTLDRLSVRTDSQEFTQQCSFIQDKLYGTSNEGTILANKSRANKKLIAIVSRLRKFENKQARILLKRERFALPPLYKF